MTTTAPVRKVHDIPIVEPYRLPVVEPYRLPVVPRELPEPERTVFPVVPIIQPVRQPERVRVL